MSVDPVPSGPSAALRMSVPLLGALRLGIGGWAAARPRQVADGVGVSAEQVEAAVPYVRALAARELVLAIGAFAAYRRGHSCAGWVAAMAASDAFDALVYELLAEIGTLDAAKARRSTQLALSGALPEAATAVALARASRVSDD
jgi:hypothetical protein